MAFFIISKMNIWENGFGEIFWNYSAEETKLGIIFLQWFTWRSSSVYLGRWVLHWEAESMMCYINRDGGFAPLGEKRHLVQSIYSWSFCGFYIYVQFCLNSKFSSPVYKVRIIIQFTFFKKFNTFWEGFESSRQQ